ncbi:hypothetical protein GF312_22645 [Candidatus Poribacteria bacterium]|nr:hypothetical protein [Candidatus Poribacteria bacterium]
MTIRLIFLILTLSFLLVIIPMALGQAEEALVGYWPMDEGSGVDIKDASGNGHNGELMEEAQWVDGKFGKALDFGPGGGYIVVPDDDQLDLSEAVTIMGWFKLNEPIAGQRRLLSKNDSIFLLFDFGAADSLDFLVKPDNAFVESATVFEVGEWYHFAGTYDGDALRMYINGVMEGETPGVPPMAVSDLDLWIGADDWQAGITTFPGVLDEIRIYSVALDENEIKQAMNGPVAVEMSGDKIPAKWSIIKTKYIPLY